MTGEQAQQLGLDYARKNFPGHQALVCTHTDGNNKSGNIHVHIVINSLRKFDVERQPFMERSCDSRAGYKHHLSKDFLIHLKQSVMDICQRENLHQVDLLTPAEEKISDREYHAGRRGQKKMEERNQKMLSEGITPRQTVPGHLQALRNHGSGTDGKLRNALSRTIPVLSHSLPPSYSKQFSMLFFLNSKISPGSLKCSPGDS